jgi:hypothetical protein
MTKLIVASYKFVNAPKIGIGGDIICEVAQCVCNDILLFQ